MSRRRFVQIDGELVEVGDGYVPEPRADHYIIPDINPFKANDGTHIKGRAHWRDHLKVTGGVEFGHSDVKAMQEIHAKKRAAHQERLKKAAPQTEVPSNARVDHSKIAVRVAERLHGRPDPDRKTLIKIALEERRRTR